MIEPRNDFVLIERIEEPQRSVIIVPDIAKSLSIKGKVLAVGPGKRDEDGNVVPIEVKPGDIVLFHSKWSDLAGSHYAEDQLHIRNLHLVMEADIFARSRRNGSARKS